MAKYTPQQIIDAKREEVRLGAELKQEAGDIKKEQERINKLKGDAKDMAQSELDMTKQMYDMKKMEYDEQKAIGTEYKKQSNTQRRLIGNAGEHIKLVIKEKDVLDSVNRAVKYQHDQASDIYTILTETSSIRNDILKTNNKEKLLSYDIAGNTEQLKEIQEKILIMAQDKTKEGQQAYKDAKAEYDLAEKAHVATSLVAEKMQVQRDLSDRLLNNIGMTTEGMKDMAKQAQLFMSAMMRNPWLIAIAAIVAMVAAFKKVLEMNMDIRDSMKMSMKQAQDFNKEIYDVNSLSKLDGFLGKEGYLWQGMKLGTDYFEDWMLGIDRKEIGASIINATGKLSDVSVDTVKQVANLQKYMGVLPEDATQLAKNFSVVTGESMSASLSTVEMVAAMAQFNDVAAGVVVADLAENMEDMMAFTDGSAEQMARAAIEAKKMGVNLATTAKIANSLLDFESSIEKEMEASLLIGKQLNFNRARQLAIEGDIAGAARDVMKQIGGQGAFQKMNVIQRRALADSIGVSVDELARLSSGKVEFKKPNEEQIQQQLSETQKATNAALALNTVALGGLTAVMAYAGKKGYNRFMGAPGSTPPPGTKINSAGRVVDAKTGRFVKTEGTTQAPKAPKTPKGGRFKGIRGKGGMAAAALLYGYDMYNILTDDTMAKADKTKEATKVTAGTGGAVAGGIGGAKIGAAIGTMIAPGIGTAIGGFLGGVGGSIAGWWAGEKTAEAAISAVEGVQEGEKEIMSHQEALRKEWSEMNETQQGYLMDAMADRAQFEEFTKQLFEQLPQVIAQAQSETDKKNLQQTQDFINLLQQIADNTGKTRAEVINLMGGD